MLPFAAGLVEVGELVGLQRPGLGRRRAGVRFVAGEVRGGSREVPVAERRAVAADAVVQFQPGDDRRVRRLAGTGVKAEAAFSGDGQPAFRIAEVQDVRVLPVLVEEVDAFLFGQAADEVIVRLAVLGAIFPLGVLVPKLEAVRPGTGAKKREAEASLLCGMCCRLLEIRWCFCAVAGGARSPRWGCPVGLCKAKAYDPG